MRFRILLSLFFILLVSASPAQEKKPQLWFGFLELGSVPTPPDQDAVTKMQAAHIDNFKRLFGEKKLFAAGPMADPEKKKRGIVVLSATSIEELKTYFGPDPYVSNGHMAINAVPCIARAPFNTKDIAPAGIEEMRIVMLKRPTTPLPKAVQNKNNAFLKSLIADGTAGAWYTLKEGDIAEVLVCLTKDTAMLQKRLDGNPAGMKADVWGQWLSGGVVPKKG